MFAVFYRTYDAFTTIANSLRAISFEKLQRLRVNIRYRLGIWIYKQYPCGNGIKESTEELFIFNQG